MYSLEPKEFKAIKEALNIKSEKSINFAKWAGAGVLGFLGLMGGSISVGYGNWRKEESTRLAAAEINHDISQLEIFRPSDPELVQENKRLRAMLAKEEAANQQASSDRPGAAIANSVNSVHHEKKLVTHDHQLA